MATPTKPLSKKERKEAIEAAVYVSIPNTSNRCDKCGGSGWIGVGGDRYHERTIKCSKCKGKGRV